jgi:hypothetical protein
MPVVNVRQAIWAVVPAHSDNCLNKSTLMTWLLRSTVRETERLPRIDARAINDPFVVYKCPLKCINFLSHS